MKNHFDSKEQEYIKYIRNLTIKRINIIMSISIFLLSLLMYLDISVRHNTIALYSRILPLFLAIVLIVLKNASTLRTKKVIQRLYNIYLASILAMMYAKYLIHYNTGVSYLNVLSIITAIFIISLEIRANLLNTILIYLVPSLIFFLVLIFFYEYRKEEFTPLINVVIILIAGFTVNSVQNNFRYKAFKSGIILKAEKKKLENTNRKLKMYQEKLEELVQKKTISLQEALKKIKESDNLKASFIQNISHEIRTPLNATMGYLQILSKNDKTIRKEYRIINKNFNDLIKTVDDIIFLSDLQTNSNKVNKTEIQAKALIDDIFTDLKKQITLYKKDLIPVIENNCNIGTQVLTDKFIYNKIASYIIDNAVKFSKEGEIKIQCEHENNMFILTISDHGIGIAENELPYVYDSFRKIEDINNISRGIGIGLSIAKKLSELISCEMIIQSQKDIGTTVLLKIQAVDHLYNI